MGHFERHAARVADIMENDDRAGDPSTPIVNRSGRILDRRFDPILRIRMLFFGKLTVWLCRTANSMGLAAVSRVSSPTTQKTSASGRPTASSRDHPVIFSAARLR